MRFVTFEHTGCLHPGVLHKGEIVAIAGAGCADVLSVICEDAAACNKVAEYVASAPPSARFDPTAVKLKAPLTRPPKIICVGLNYRDHAIESKMEIPTVPTIFSKYATSVIGPGESIVLPKNSAKPDYEAEMAVIIGKGGRHIPAERWKEHVFGYTILNDVSARDFQMATSQWMMGKTFDTFAPMGPSITTADEVEDPHALDISMTINGEVRQSSNTKHLIFRVPELIAYLSSVFTLEPGDVISTGTPSGVGFSYNPPKWLQPGDDVVVKVQGLGELRNSCVAEAQAADA